jgi:hypothetical protein
MNARTLTIFRLYQLFNGIAFTGPIWAVFLRAVAHPVRAG